MDWQVVGVQLAPYMTALFVWGALGSLWFVRRLRRTARATSFGYVRERSTEHARRMIIAGIILIILSAASAALWIVSLRRPELLPTPVPTATVTLIPSPTPRTPTATFTPTLTPTITPTPTVTPIPPDAQLPSVLRTPFPPQAVSAGPDAALIDLVLARGERNDQPVDPGTRFPSGTNQVYAFLTFDGMSRNVPWAHVWYAKVEGKMVEVWSEVELWPYNAPAGSTWRYLNCRDGQYELHIYVDRELEQKIPFFVGDG